MTRKIVDSVASEYRRYKSLAEGAMEQLSDEELGRTGAGGENSVATIAWHVSGNLSSRFTDFLESDGEKPWRDRESEFEPRRVSAEALRAKWDEGWTTLFQALETLTDEDLDREVTIREIPHTVAEALHRSLAHTSYHVGQIVHQARAFRGESWRFLSIPPGGSA